MANPFLISGNSGKYSGTYQSEYRAPNQLKFLYQKIAYANCGGLSTPQGGGIGPGSNSFKLGGLYQNAEATKDKAGNIISDSARFVPKAHITSIRSSNEGDMGSIVRCEVGFTCYTVGQLNGQSHMFVPGKSITASWGWSTGGGVTFRGKIINFSYSLNADGGFDCTTTAIGPAMAIPNLNPNAGIIGGTTFTDALGKAFQGGSLVTNLYTEAAQKVGAGATTSNYSDGIGGFAIDEAWTTQPVDPATPIPAGQKKIYLYASLGKIVAEANKILTSAGLAGNISIVPWSTDPFGGRPSASPLTVLVNPGPYGAITFDGMATVSTNPGDVAVSIDFLKTLAFEIESDNKPSGKSRDVTLSNFFDQILTEIGAATGNACALTMAGSRENKQSVVIADAEDTDEGIDKGTIVAVTQGGEARSMTISATLPSEIAAMAYISNNPSSIKTGAPDLTAIGGTAPAAADNTWPEALQALSDTGAFPETVATAKSQLAALVKGRQSSGTVPMPIDFGATVDGQGTWKWGMAVTSNYLPGNYQASNVYFVVTKVEHNVSNGDWTTTIQTLMRVGRK